MKVFAENRKARNSYEFQEFYEAGIVLTGPETKSVRTGAVSIVDAFAIIENEEGFLMEMNIEPYKYADQTDYNPKNQRNPKNLEKFLVDQPHKKKKFHQYLNNIMI